jgi:hypothetical protein
VLDKVTIAYRGATYEIGRGRDYFGIWTIGGSRSQPLEWWPETQEGWSAAWTRFAILEPPDEITPAAGNTAWSGEQPGASPRFAPVIGTGRGAVAAALLLGVGVALGIAGLFPDYLNGSSLASQPDNLVAHVIYLATWTASAVLIALGGTRLRIGALLATGLSIVTFGLFLADAGTPISGGAHLGGAGLVLSCLGWLVCAAGSAVAFLSQAGRTTTPVSAGGPFPAHGPVPAAGPAAGPVPGTSSPAASRRLVTLGWPRGRALGPAVLLVLAGLGTAAAFAPAWDSFTLRAASGQTQTITLGNAFANPAAVVAGNVIVMVALAAVVIVAALWRPVRYGAVLLAGAIIPMAAQAISALVQVGQAISPTQFGFTPAQVSQLGLTISAGLTPAFWIYCVFVVVLLVSCAWMLFTPREEAILISAGSAPDADPRVPMWHVARADAHDVARAGAYDTTGVLDDNDWDIDETADGGEFDSHEVFDSDHPADSTVRPESQPDERDEPGRPD